jgi:hypothetical protein
MGWAWAGPFCFVAGIGFDVVIGTLDTPLALRLLAPVIILLGVLTVARSGSAFHRGRVRDARWKLWIAWTITAALVLAHLWLTTWTSREDGFWAALATAACLTTAATIGLQTVLAHRPRLPVALAAQAALLGGVTLLLLGLTFLTDETPFISPVMLGAVVLVLCGLASLLGGVVALLFGVALPGIRTLVGIATVLLGATFLLAGVAKLAYEATLEGIPPLLIGVATLLAGIAILLYGTARSHRVAFLLGGTAGPLGAVASLVIGVTAMLDGRVSWGVANALIGVALLLLTAMHLTGRRTLGGIAILVSGVAFLLFGVTTLIEGGDTPFGVANVLLGLAVLIERVLLRGRPSRALAYLRAPVPLDNDDHRD